MTEEEFNHWINDNKAPISHEYITDKNASGNTHKYTEGVRYVHFFKDLLDAPVILQIMPLNATHLCRFELPIDLLASRQGRGVYYDEELDSVEVAEYAIDIDSIDSMSLKDYRIIKDISMAKYLDDGRGWISIDREQSMEI